MDENENKKTSVYYKDKAAYNQALLDALKDVRKKRVDDPVRAFPNAVVAFEMILLPDERAEVNAYKLDPSDHTDEIQKAKDAANSTDNPRLMVEILLNGYKAISWPLYRDLCEDLHKKSLFPDVSGDGQVDRIDITISIYEALLGKIIAILKNHGWLTFENNSDTTGGSGGGLESDKGTDSTTDDLS